MENNQLKVWNFSGINFLTMRLVNKSSFSSQARQTLIKKRFNFESK